VVYASAHVVLEREAEVREDMKQVGKDGCRISCSLAQHPPPTHTHIHIHTHSHAHTRAHTHTQAKVRM